MQIEEIQFSFELQRGTVNIKSVFVDELFIVQYCYHIKNTENVLLQHLRRYLCVYGIFLD